MEARPRLRHGEQDRGTHGTHISDGEADRVRGLHLPHYYFPTDNRWQFRDPLGSVMHENHLFARTGEGNKDLLPGIKVNTDAMARMSQLFQEGFVQITEWD